MTSIKEQEFLANAARLRIQGQTVSADCSNCKHMAVTFRPWCSRRPIPPPGYVCSDFCLGVSPYRATSHDLIPDTNFPTLSNFQK